jgi:hypothetical protein
MKVYDERATPARHEDPGISARSVTFAGGH